MQDKALDAMAQKYKEEMMKLYSKHPTGASTVQTAAPAAQEVTVKPRKEAVNEVSQQSEEQTARRDTERLMHPPMPQIPSFPPKKEEKANEKGKFLPPEELFPLPKFDTGREQTHEQGNYDFTAEQGGSTRGEGCLKLEVSSGGKPVDCAAVAVFRSTAEGDVLTAAFCTDERGETEVMTLPVPDLDERYTISVAKEGFYTVRGLEIPIFDSIKSIQPVELKQE